MSGTLKKGRLITGALFLFVGIAGLAGLVAGAKITWDNQRHAARVFTGLPHAEVIASRRWLPLGNGGGLDCTYAIVALFPVAQVAPPDLPQRAFPHDWGGDWTPTPASWGGTRARARSPCAIPANSG